MSDSLNNVHEQYAELQATITELQAKVEKLKAQATIDTVTKSRDYWKNHFEDAEIELMIKALEHQSELLPAACYGSAAKLIKRLALEKAQLQAKVEKQQATITELTDDLRGMEIIVKDLSDQLKQTQLTITELEAKVYAAYALADEYYELNEKLIAKVEELTAELNNHDYKLGKTVKTLQAKVEKLEAENRRLGAECRRLESPLCTR